MNADIKSNAITEAEARKLVGDKAVDAVLAENCEFTNRCIDDVFGVVEMSASIDVGDENGQKLVVLYLVSKDELDECEGELDRLDYSNYTFEVL